MKTYFEINVEDYNKIIKELELYFKEAKKFLDTKKEEIRQNIEENSQKLEEFKSLYSKVVGKFPSIKPEELKLEYDNLYDGFAGIRVLNDDYCRDPVMRAGRKFLSFDDYEKEAIIAHEIGHYCRMRNYSVERLRRTGRWTLRSGYYDASDVTSSKKIMYKVKRLQKWYNMREIDADNLAYKAGYGRQVLKALKKTCEISYESSSMIGKNCILARIENLEEKLGKECV